MAETLEKQTILSIDDAGSLKYLNRVVSPPAYFHPTLPTQGDSHVYSNLSSNLYIPDREDSIGKDQQKINEDEWSVSEGGIGDEFFDFSCAPTNLQNQPIEDDAEFKDVFDVSIPESDERDSSEKGDELVFRKQHPIEIHLEKQEFIDEDSNSNESYFSADMNDHEHLIQAEVSERCGLEDVPFPRTPEKPGSSSDSCVVPVDQNAQQDKVLKRDSVWDFTNQGGEYQGVDLQDVHHGGAWDFDQDPFTPEDILLPVTLQIHENANFPKSDHSSTCKDNPIDSDRTEPHNTDDVKEFMHIVQERESPFNTEGRNESIIFAAEKVEVGDIDDEELFSPAPVVRISTMHGKESVIFLCDDMVPGLTTLQQSYSMTANLLKLSAEENLTKIATQKQQSLSRTFQVQAEASENVKQIRSPMKQDNSKARNLPFIPESSHQVSNHASDDSKKFGQPGPYRFPDSYDLHNQMHLSKYGHLHQAPITPRINSFETSITSGTVCLKEFRSPCPDTLDFHMQKFLSLLLCIRFADFFERSCQYTSAMLDHFVVQVAHQTYPLFTSAHKHYIYANENLMDFLELTWPPFHQLIRGTTYLSTKHNVCRPEFLFEACKVAFRRKAKVCFLMCQLTSFLLVYFDGSYCIYDPFILADNPALVSVRTKARDGCSVVARFATLSEAEVYLCNRLYQPAMTYQDFRFFELRMHESK
eukprot:TRINITY_DN5659_c0_g1_i2.p1 TRINITY_DN5659_c0_g1~~TRINITY_DN5659_c0_g1_i2.p1  ORF type:complete len:700 (+),score=137.95 TRINITY_DN5659_c0_g1_i2:44-2143(+)